MKDDAWLQSAMADDTLVVGILMQMNQQSEEKTKLLPTAAARKRTDTVSSSTASPSLEWTVRHRRSKQTMMMVPSRGGAGGGGDGDVCGDDDVKKGESITRVSPTTPLSWSGGTSVCGGATIDGAEECSRQLNLSELARSKVISPSETTPTNRPRKKKTLVELKEEETLLLNERKHLQDELASLQFSVKKQRSTNESLKRTKFDMQSRAVVNKVPTSLESENLACMQHNQIKVSCGVSHQSLPATASIYPFDRLIAKTDQSLSTQSPKSQKIVLLPDLNLPCEDNSNSDFLCTVR